MKKEPKHLYSYDPKTGRKFVIKTRNPALIGEIHEFYKEEINMDIEPSTNISSKIDHQGKYYIFRLIRFFDEVPNVSQEDANNIARLMRRAVEWYVYAIVKKEEQ